MADTALRNPLILLDYKPLRLVEGSTWMDTGRYLGQLSPVLVLW
jgi:hypothetical protein